MNKFMCGLFFFSRGNLQNEEEESLIEIAAYENSA